MKTSLKLVLISSLAFIACEGDDASKPKTITNTVEIPKEVIVEKEIEVVPETKLENGFFVSAEGNFGSKDGSIAFVTDDLSVSTNFIYRKINENTPLAGLVQSVAFGNENAYIVLNDANSLVIVDKLTFKKKAVVTSGLQNPRYMAIIGNKGYITNWGDGSDTEDDYLAVLDLETNKLDEATISLPNGVEQIIARGNKLYVTHKGAFGSNNIVSVVDTSASNAVTSIVVKDNPDELFFTEDGTLVVLSEGKPTNFGPAPIFRAIERTASSISFININSNTVTKELAFNENEGSEFLVYSNGKIYYNIATKVFEISENAMSLATPESGIEVGDSNGINVRNNMLFSVSFTFTTFSTLTSIDLESKSTIFASVVGLGASKIYFNDL